MKAVLFRATAVMLALGLMSAPAAAYIGPGLGLGAIGAVLGSIAAFFMVILGLIWYPFKIMLRKLRGKKSDAMSAESSTPSATLDAREDKQ